jgi:putative CocE/NonD family hydrolase
MELMDRKGKGSISGWEMMRQLGPSSVARHLPPAFGHLPLREADEVALGYPVPYYRDWLAHPQADDPYWESIDHRAHLGRVAAPVHLVSGWYDFLLRELLTDYDALTEAGHSPYLTIGPWAHTDLGAIGEALRQGVDWFDAHLRGNRRRLREKPVRVWVMGADEWREMDTWPPPAQETRLYLHPERRLSPEASAADSPPDHYRYDPADPTPAVGGALFMPPSGAVDNRALEARHDVLTYTAEPLAQGVDVIGPVRLALYVRSSLAHADFFGRLCDVHPDGRSINVCDGLLRIEPGKGEAQPDGSLRIDVYMWATAYRFQRGHRLRLQVSSGAHPRWSRNLGTGEPLATGIRMLAADQTVFHDCAHPSALVLPVTLQ